MRIFGTDGIRGKAEYLFENGFAYKLGVALSQKAQDKMYGAPKRVAVARDVRLSSPALERELINGLLLGGAEVLVCGVLPTPALAYVAEKECADYAVMITASHNPPEYNGLKVFGKGGKLNLEDECALDRRVSEFRRDCMPTKGNENGSVRVIDGAMRAYSLHLLSQFPDFDGAKVYLDCAHGCMARLAPDVMSLLGCNVVGINNDRDGSKVNVCCGATYLDDFINAVPEGGIGFSFDGDGDRVLTIYGGGLYDGDQALYALAEFYRRQGRLVNSSVVGTVLTNGALEREFALRGITLHRADVGDKFVLEKMKETGAVIGGEKSGHTIMSDQARTGDGLLTALSLLYALRDMGELPRFAPYPTFAFNIPVENPKTYVMSDDFNEKVYKAEQIIGRKGRMIARASGTEPAVRITVEVNESLRECEKAIKNLFSSKN